MRDKVIHDDFDVNLEIVRAVVERELPKLKVAIADLRIASRPLLRLRSDDHLRGFNLVYPSVS